MWEGRKRARRVVILEEKIEKVQINVAETKVKIEFLQGNKSSED